MRVIAGKAKRLPLKTPKGMDTRPTTDRIKETLFNMIQDELYDIHFLDLFSGSGAIGIEALSRGAKDACFVEQNKAAAEIIRQNLVFTKLNEQAEVLVCSALASLTLTFRVNLSCLSIPLFFQSMLESSFFSFSSCGSEKISSSIVIS